MKQKWKFLFVFILSLQITSIALFAETVTELALVAGKNSQVVSLSEREIKKLFLGLPVTKENVRIKLVRNLSDEKINEIFLQKVVFMSERRYEHRMLSNVFRYGNDRPEEFQNMKALTEELTRNPQAVSYMWAEDIEKYDSIKSLGTLWAGKID